MASLAWQCCGCDEVFWGGRGGLQRSFITCIQDFLTNDEKSDNADLFVKKTKKKQRTAAATAVLSLTYIWRRRSICIPLVVSWLGWTRQRWRSWGSLATTSECWWLAPDLTLQAAGNKRITWHSCHNLASDFCGLVIRALGGFSPPALLLLSKKAWLTFSENLCVFCNSNKKNFFFFLTSLSVKVFSSHPRHVFFFFMRPHQQQVKWFAVLFSHGFHQLERNPFSYFFESHLLAEPSGCELCKYCTGVSAHMLEWCQTGRSISGPSPLWEPVKRRWHNIWISELCHYVKSLKLRHCQ